jgi:hypothetical protein
MAGELGVIVVDRQRMKFCCNFVVKVKLINKKPLRKLKFCFY